ncbi:hypothetical protein ONS96_005778 [Cadophora gregata f. sp. sojae]|nr:hypothetical protein ONS96_005778 [Cadophora gregata f. sp. sojae]
MCITHQRCSICENHYEKFTKDCPSESPQNAEGTCNEHSKYLDREDGWCLGIGIVCYKCSKITAGEPMTPKFKNRQAGAWKRMLKAKLMDKKREAEDARWEDEMGMEVGARAEAVEHAEVWRKEVEVVVAAEKGKKVKNELNASKLELANFK